MKTIIHRRSAVSLAVTLMILAAPAHAGFKINVTHDDVIEFGGYIKADARFVDGDVAYRDFWIGTGTPLAEDASQFNMNVRETRFNTKYTHGDVVGFLELDFEATDNGNQVISNSYSPRLRHAFIRYKQILFGQTWTTFMNTSAIPEAADFAGPDVGLAFVRQGQFRFNVGNWQLALENPETFGGDPANDDMPDFIAKYVFKGDWGNVSVAGLGRRLTTQGGEHESSFGASIAGQIKTFGKDDLRFQFHEGELGRYVSVAGSPDVAGEVVEDVTSYMVAYRHYWSGTWRSTAFYGRVDTDVTDRERTQWGVNLFKNLTPKLAFGIEFGNFAIDDQDVDSDYAQFTAKYVL